MENDALASGGWSRAMGDPAGATRIAGGVFHIPLRIKKLLL
jgi:hypothetical protein